MNLLTLLNNDFLIRSFLAAFAIALVSGPLGCLMVWKKMAYFGDSLAHSSLLGIALGLIYGLNLNFSILIVALIFALVLMLIESKSNLPVDSILGVIAHTSLALGVVLLFLLSKRSLNLNAFLFGDILMVNYSDLIWIYSGSFIGLILLYFNWSNLVFYVINKDLAKTYGINIFYLKLLLNLLLALIIAISIQIIGVLLIISLLIIPASSAKLRTKSTVSMAILASIIGLIASFSGLSLSVYWDIPSGASIVICLGIIFALMFCYAIFKEKFENKTILNSHNQVKVN